MAFQVSPGVQIKEIDATNVVPAVSTSIGGFAGSFNWGPVDKVISVSSEENLVESFGQPDNNTFKHFFVAASFLKYGNALKVVRVLSGHDNATADGTGQLIKNDEDYDNNYANGSLSKGDWVAKYPGSLGNSLKVSVITQGISDFSAWAYSSNFDGAPTTSQYASDLGKSSANDEMHIAVIDEDGLISGTPNQVLETFAFVSQASDAKKTDGTSNFYKDVVNTQSKWIWWADHNTSLSDAGETVSDNTSFTTSTSAIEASLSGGSDDNAPTTGEIAVGFDKLEDAESEDVNLIFAAPDANGANTIANDLISIAVARKDCMAFVSPPIEDTVGSSTPAADVKSFADSLTSSSYASCDSTALYIYDKYNDVYRYIGAAGHQAGLCANADRVADTWFSPAGVNRGQLLGVTKLAFNPKKADRDTLYKARVNPIVSMPGQGTLLFGDKTLLSRPSAFDRINVRRLFIALEKAISTAAKAQLFEFNDEFTRAQFKNLVEPFLRDVKGRRGLTDFLVVCDTTNNTSQVIDSNQFVADIFIKPARSINFITLNFIATRTGVEFSEIAGQ
jgi:phage tail sheath protein FI|tara:strand:- start:5779 stop:7464 length:1686 start_codon:yes stop_codon:yes gene_type:complete